MFLNYSMGSSRSYAAHRKSAALTTVLCLLALTANSWALDVLVNQVGYETNGPKVFRVQRTADYAGDGTFAVRRVSDNADVLTGSLTRKGSIWNKWYWEGDFSSYRIGGNYYVYATVNAESGSSYNFSISLGALLNKTGVPTYQYFTAQRCGTAVSFQYVNRAGQIVTWSHNLCHTDDGYINPSGPYLDTAGGWHDSGEYQKYGQFFGGHAVYDLLTLYDSNRGYFDAFDTNSNSIADILDEAVYQARWLAKMVQPNGHVMKQISMRRSGESWRKPENDTDRVIGTSDDRWVEIGDCITPTEIIVCSSLIKMHRVLASKGLPTENFGSKALAIWNHRVALAMSEGGHNNLGSGGHHVWAGLDLYAVFGQEQQDCWNRAVQKIDEMANGAISNPACYDDAAEGAGYDLAALALFARNYPSDPKAALARTAVQALMTHHMSMADDPVGLIRRLESGQTIYFPANPGLGLNRLYGTITWGAIEAYKLLGDLSYLRFALDQYNWMLGANYFRTCMMEAVGDSFVNKYHTRYDTFITNGIEPGVVINGYIRDGSGLPWLDFGTGSVSAQANESWLPNSAAYAAGLAGMAVFQDNAQQVSDTIPAVMTAGANCTVSITVRNSSFMVWDSTNYKLGAVDDSDPFAPGRQLIANGATVNPGQQYTFTFTMTAPATPGAYTTDWRMVQEYVNWFGDTLTKQVQVLNSSPPAPVTNLTAAPAVHQILLSWTNPSSANFTGTMIRYSTSGYPATPSAGSLLIDQPNAPGSPGSFLHTGPASDARYYYALFAHNGLPAYASAATVSAASISSADFDRDGDVDQEDFGHLQACLTEVGLPAGPDCSDADLDEDLGANWLDLIIFQTCLAGANHLPACAE